MIKEIKNNDQKKHITYQILRDLPEWFGIESALQTYAESAIEMPYFVYCHEDEIIGFVALKSHGLNMELYVLGVLKAFHRKGYGRALIDHVENWARLKKIKYMTVKTLAATHPDIHYKKTRLFYEMLGYESLEILPTLWGKENPCLYMIKRL